jgi:hypothetical protein
MPFILTNSWGYEFAQPVGTAVRWGHNYSGREQKSESAFQYLVKSFLAFGPLGVAEVRTE